MIISDTSQTIASKIESLFYTIENEKLSVEERRIKLNELIQTFSNEQYQTGIKQGLHRASASIQKQLRDITNDL